MAPLGATGFRHRPNVPVPPPKSGSRSSACLDIQKREVATIQNRVFKSVQPADLASTRFAKHWILAAVMCPGDDTTNLASFAKGLDPADRDRIRFYWHKGAKPGEALRAWLDAGLGPIQDDDIDGWERFHQLFGAHHSIQVYRDHVGAG